MKELVKEGEAEVQAVIGAISGMVKTAVADFFVPSSSSKASSSEGGGLSPALHAGVVAGAELVAVLMGTRDLQTLRWLSSLSFLPELQP